MIDLTSLTDWAFVCTFLSACTVFYCGYRGILNTYYLGGDPEYRPELRRIATGAMFAFFVLGCVLTLF